MTSACPAITGTLEPARASTTVLTGPSTEASKYTLEPFTTRSRRSSQPSTGLRSFSAETPGTTTDAEIGDGETYESQSL